MPGAEEVKASRGVECRMPRIPEELADAFDEYIAGPERLRDAVRDLDATILKSFVFDRIGIKSDDIMYTQDIDRVMNMVDE